MRGFWNIENVSYVFLMAFVACSFPLVQRAPLLLLLLLPLFLAINAVTGFFDRGIYNKRLRICYHGASLLGIFLGSLLLSIPAHVGLGFYYLPGDWRGFLFSALYCFLLHFLLFWNGILCVYLTSAQLGIRRRVLGAIAGWIPVLNLFALTRILQITFAEVRFETLKARTNDARAADRICATKYPILFVHGVFFRDSRLFNYWGRIPAELKKNGARVFYGEHDSARAVSESAAELALRIEWIVKKTGCEKLNVIAHSKGGLDTRYAMAYLGAAPYIASLTTVNTPHNGCVFANKLLKKLPQKLIDRVACSYNVVAEKAGDEAPDFLAAVTDLTDEACARRNAQMPLPEGVYCQSIGSRLNRAQSGRFPLNVSYRLVKYYDGPNDGLVAEDSFPFGEKYTLLCVKGRRGISHSDIVDMGKENLPEFDVREFYVQLVRDLKERGF